MTVAVFIAGTLVIGFLLGERYALRQCNEILDHNTKALLDAICEGSAVPIEQEDNTPVSPTVH